MMFSLWCFVSYLVLWVVIVVILSFSHDLMKYLSLLHIIVYICLGIFLPFFFLMKSKRGRMVWCVLKKFQDYCEEVTNFKGKRESYYSWLDQIFKWFCHNKKGRRLKKYFLDLLALGFWWLQIQSKRKKELKKKEC